MRHLVALVSILAGLIVSGHTIAAPSASATIRAEKCDAGYGMIQAHNEPNNSDSTTLYHNLHSVSYQNTSPPGEGHPGGYCTDITVPDYSLPSGNVSAWYPNNSDHVITCDGPYDGTKIIVRGDTPYTYQRYEVYTVGGLWLYETIRGGYSYPNGFRQNTIRYSTTRCTGDFG